MPGRCGQALQLQEEDQEKSVPQRFDNSLQGQVYCSWGLRQQVYQAGQSCCASQKMRHRCSEWISGAVEPARRGVLCVCMDEQRRVLIGLKF
jgi:hypothetical protein